MPNSQSVAIWKRIGADILRIGLVTLVFLIALLFGRYRLATIFRVYDDEGYFLLMNKHYLDGERLYTEVFSQYGPFYISAQKALYRLLQLPVTHDAGREVTLICWLLSAVLAGYFSYKLSKNLIWGCIAGLASMSLTRVLANEPGHPQQILLPILMLAFCVSTSDGMISLFLLGALGTALVFTKINVGIFYLAAVAATLICGFPAGRIRTIGGYFLLFYAVSFPVVLMHRDVPGWAFRYCLVAILGGVSAILAGLLTSPASPKPWRRVLYVSVGVVIATIAIVFGTELQGMSARTLMEGVVWGPSRHPGVFSVQFWIPKTSILMAALVAGSVACLYRFRNRWQSHADWVDALRCMVGLFLVCTLPVLPWLFLGRIFPCAMMFLPLGLLPINGRAWQPAEYFPRLFVTCMAATQFLQAYPVAGSQLNIAATPLLLWAVFCFHDGADGLFRLVTHRRDRSGYAVFGESVFGGLVIVFLAVIMLGSGTLRHAPSNPSSSLRGASSLHLPASMEGTYEFLANDVAANCDVLFTMPGMGSLNFWSGAPTPNGLNLTAWMKGLEVKQQEQILQILKTQPRACVVYAAELVSSWETSREELDGLPLARYILYKMPVVAQKGGYEIRVSPQRNSPWIDAATRSSGNQIEHLQ